MAWRLALGQGWRGSAAVTERTKIVEGVFAEDLSPRQRVLGFRARPSAKASLLRAFLCRGPQLAALGKEYLCRVPEIWPSAKSQAFGKERVSSSATHWSNTDELLRGLCSFLLQRLCQDVHWSCMTMPRWIIMHCLHLLFSTVQSFAGSSFLSSI